MRFLSYLIITTVVLTITLSLRNSLDAIHQKDIVFYHYSMPKVEIDIFDPIIQTVLADSK
ncbi:MAG TPA: hypothetical protein VLG12_05285 [Candidatus Saccharimonadales bacterium]|nr:hypothetical protein [Candidatus Saccharimonadales bacterium]